MDELVAFLRAALDRDEQEIAKHPADAYEYDLEATEESDYPCLPILVIGKKRALAEVEAKRRILDLHWPDTSRYIKPQCHECSSCGCCSVDHPCDTIRLLAQPYAGQPGWREEWAQ